MSGTRENETFIAFPRGKRPFNAARMTFPSRVACTLWFMEVKEGRGWRSSDREIGIFRARRAARKRRRYARLGKGATFITVIIRTLAVVVKSRMRMRDPRRDLSRSKASRNIRYNGINRSGNKMVIAIVVTGYLASAAEYYYRYVRGKRVKRGRGKKKEEEREKKAGRR